MRGPNSVAIAHKKPGPEMSKLQKTESKMTKGRGSKNSGAPKDSAAPKRPPGAFFIFMEDFRKSFKEKFPDNKSVSMVGKAGGNKWKSMSEADKVPYFVKAQSRKAEYEKALEVYQKRAIGGMIIEKPAESEKSSSEVHDYAEQEASS